MRATTLTGRAPAPLSLFACTVLYSCAGDEPVVPPDPEPDVPTALVVLAGDAQVATTGTAVPDPIQVRVTGRTGATLAGVSVTFAVTAGGGSIERASATSDANGIASPGRWTLGPPGPQQMRGDVLGVAPVVISATATGAPAEIAAVAGADQEVAVGSAVPVRPEVLVTDADGEPLQGVRVTFVTERDAAVTGGEAITAASGRAAVGGWTLGTTTGGYWLEAWLDGTGIKGNPVRFEARALPGPAAELVAIEGDGQESETKLPVPVQPRVRVLDAHGNAVPGAPVGFSADRGSVAIPPRRDTDEDGFVAVDKWVLGDAAGVTYRLVVTVLDATVPPLTFTATATEAVYEIVIVHASPDALSQSQRTAFERAEAFWERAITGNLFWSTLRQHSLELCLARNGFDLDVPGDRVVDDLLIYADIREIDGRGGTIAGAGPCQIRADSGLPVVGTMYFDLADLEGLEEKGHLDGTILHEMAHVIGFGAMWEYLGLLKEPAGSTSGADPHFVGPEALKAFDQIGGASYTASKPVPVEAVGGPGVWNGHWREFVFRTELMTSFIDSGLNPLSIVTLASMTDMGYTGVDISLADEFVLPAATAADAAHPAGRIDLGDDLIRGPVAVVEQDGTVVGYVTLTGSGHPPGHQHPDQDQP